MFQDQHSALRDALERRPRGLKNGDTVEYGSRRFTVIGIQQWMTGGSPHAVGLVWGARCSGCKKPWHQCTSTRPGALSEMCPECDVIGSREPTLDLRVAEELLGRTSVATMSGLPIKRRGRVETFVLEVLAAYGDAETIKLDEFVDKAVGLMPEPQEGERDTRRQRVTRALESLSRERESPVQVKSGVVIRYDQPEG